MITPMPQINAMVSIFIQLNDLDDLYCVRYYKTGLYSYHLSILNKIILHKYLIIIIDVFNFLIQLLRLDQTLFLVTKSPSQNTAFYQSALATVAVALGQKLASTWFDLVEVNQ